MENMESIISSKQVQEMLKLFEKASSDAEAKKNYLAGVMAGLNFASELEKMNA